MERWLLLSNCQTSGLANCLNLLNPDFDVTGVDVWRYLQENEKYNTDMPDYFRVVVNPSLTHLPGYDVSRAHHVSFLPEVNFDGYHPDLCGARSGETIIKAAIDDYHSMIALAAFRNGLTVEQTLPFYNGEVYERAGFFEAWAPARDRLIDHLAHYGVDVRELFPRWGLRRAFMYSVNHPRIEVLQDVARLFMLAHGVPVKQTDLLPADNLANGAYFPVYPEIGEALGIEGSYLFKPLAQYRYLSLEQVLNASFDAFSAYPRESLEAIGDLARFARVEAIIRGEA